MAHLGFDEHSKKNKGEEDTVQKNKYTILNGHITGKKTGPVRRAKDGTGVSQEEQGGGKKDV